MVDKKKIRVNISVDKELLEKAKSKLGLFGGKLSSLFNAYLADFVKSFDKNISGNYEYLRNRVKELEKLTRRIERKVYK